MDASNLTVRIPMRKVTEKLTMHVTMSGVRTFRIRLAISVWLLRLAALVAGVGIQVETRAAKEG